MAQSANVAVDNFQLPDGVDPNTVKRNKEGVVIEWRQPTPNAYKGGVVMARSKDKDGNWVTREKVFSLSAGISERFNDEVDTSLESFIKEEAARLGKVDGNGEPLDSFASDAPTRAQYIRTLVADAIGYDLALEPEREPKGAGLAEHRERVKQKTTGFDAIMAMAQNDPELLAKLQSIGVMPVAQ